MLDEEWIGWEADFLVDAVEHWIHSQAVAVRRDERRYLARLIGGRRV